MSNDVLGVRRPERDMLRGFLDWYRAVVTNKLVGLSLEQASQVMTPTGLSPLGILKHLALSEAGWLRGCFAGQPVPAEVSGPQSFRVAPGRHDRLGRCCVPGRVHSLMSDRRRRDLPRPALRTPR